MYSSVNGSNQCFNVKTRQSFKPGTWQTSRWSVISLLRERGGTSSPQGKDELLQCLSLLPWRYRCEDGGYFSGEKGQGNMSLLSWESRWTTLFLTERDGSVSADWLILWLRPTAHFADLVNKCFMGGASPAATTLASVWALCRTSALWSALSNHQRAWTDRDTVTSLTHTV